MHAPDEAAKTGRFMIVLSMDTSDETFYDLAQKVKDKSKDEEIQEVNGIVAKIITATLSENDLEDVSST